MIELLDIRYAQNHILDEDVMQNLQGPLSPGNLKLILPLHILNKRARHIEHNDERCVRLECVTKMHTVI